MTAPAGETANGKKGVISDKNGGTGVTGIPV
jgi:hypothetical protein